MITLIRGRQRIEIIETNNVFDILEDGNIVATIDSPQLVLFLKEKWNNGWREK